MASWPKYILINQNFKYDS